MTNGCITDNSLFESPSGGYPVVLNPELDQEIIYQFFITGVKNWDVEQVLDLFERVFLYLSCSEFPKVDRAINQIIESNNELIFNNTLKRVCYILVNNWYINRQSKAVHTLIKTLDQAREDDSIAISPNLNRLGKWLMKFLGSPAYQDIRNCAFSHKRDWTSRYTSYLLVPQYINAQNSEEQKSFARNLSKQLRDKYKFDLAMYIARSESSVSSQEKRVNPTKLGDDVLHLIKRTISVQRISSYKAQANCFLQETKQLNYANFKKSLPNYLMISNSTQYPINVVRDKLEKKLDNLYEHYHDQTFNKGLMIRTCNRMIEALTTEDNQTPSAIFILLTSRGNPLTLVILLLKLVLICSSARTYVELCISKLIEHYQDFEEEQCQRLIYFLEIFNLVFTIFTENVQFHLVKVKENEPSKSLFNNLESYRLFCQSKGHDLRGADLKQMDLSSLELKGADLRETDLTEVELIQMDLRLANLSQANLQGAILNESRLVVANLNHANLSDASLIGTDLRRADLQGSNLTNATLTSATLDLANLHQANLHQANLLAASLQSSDLSQVDLRSADLQYANLRGANLKGVNLSYANLKGANLQDVNLQGANLIGANLQQANLDRADIQQANLEGANLHRANLSGAHLQGANLSNVDLSEANLKQVNLRGANLNYAVVRHAHLSRAILTQATICHADLTRAQLVKVDFSSANLYYALIRHANLTKANFGKANLKGANLFGSNIIEANVQGAKFGNNSGVSEEMKRYLKLEPRE